MKFKKITIAAPTASSKKFCQWFSFFNIPVLVGITIIGT